MSGWGERQTQQRTILECPMGGCPEAVLGSVGLMSRRFCPTHDVPLVASMWTRVYVPQPAKKR